MQKSVLDRFEKNPTKLFGIYRGVVEDRKDPLRLGRVRVRIWGVHTEEQSGDYNKAPYDQLQWAHPCLSTFGGSISDVGAFYVPLQGSHVFVFFENGNMMQPRYFSSAPGYPIDGAKFSQFEKQDGFIDPDEEYPLTDHIEEHDWHRLHRKDKLGKTYLDIKEKNLDLGVLIAFGGAWDEQPPMYEAEYPDNNVFTTQEEYDKNQVIELDGTKGAQRLQYWHPSKSYFEFNKDGLYVFRNAKHRWDICDEIKHVHTMSHHHEKVDGGYTLNIGEAEFREIAESRNTRIYDFDWKMSVDDDLYWTIGSKKRIVISTTHLFGIASIKNTTMDSYGILALSDIKTVAVSTMEIGSVSSMKIVALAGRASFVTGQETVLSTGNMLLTSNAVIHCKAAANFLGHAPLAYINGTAMAGVKGGAMAGLSAPYCGVGGGLVEIGPTVRLGATPAPVVPPTPISAPAVSVSAPTASVPPGPDSPPEPAEVVEFPFEDEPVIIPEPEC
jgi:hypothetical protein